MGSVCVDFEPVPVVPFNRKRGSLTLKYYNNAKLRNN